MLVLLVLKAVFKLLLVILCCHLLDFFLFIVVALKVFKRPHVLLDFFGKSLLIGRDGTLLVLLEHELLLEIVILISRHIQRVNVLREYVRAQVPLTDLLDSV